MPRTASLVISAIRFCMSDLRSPDNDALFDMLRDALRMMDHADVVEYVFENVPVLTVCPQDIIIEILESAFHEGAGSHGTACAEDYYAACLDAIYDRVRENADAIARASVQGGELARFFAAIAAAKYGALDASSAALEIASDLGRDRFFSDDQLEALGSALARSMPPGAASADDLRQRILGASVRPQSPAYDPDRGE